MANKKESPFVNLGLSSLMVVFLVLCLAIFSALTLSGANSSMAFSQRMADRETAYFAACSRAEEILDVLDERLSETGADSDFSDLGVVSQGDRLYFTVPLSEGQVLSVSLRLTPGGKHYYEIESWKTVASLETKTDTLPLMTIGGE